MTCNAELEMVQHSTATFVKGNFQWTASHGWMEVMDRPTLKSRWENLSLEVFKIFNLTCNSNLIVNIFRANLRVQRHHSH